MIAGSDGIGRPSDDLRVGERQIVDLAQRRLACLLRLRAKRRHGTRAAGILLGSVATAMLHEAPRPVLVARPARDDPWFPRSIVVGVDGSPQSLEAAETATALAERFGADLRSLAAEGGQPLDIDGLGHIDELEWDRRQPVSAFVAASKNADLVIVGGRGLSGVRAPRQRQRSCRPSRALLGARRAAHDPIGELCVTARRGWN